LRAGWRLCLFIALFLTLQIVSETIIRTFIRPAPAVLTPSYLLLVEIVRFIALMLAAFAMSLMEQRSINVYGLPFASALGKRFWQGFFVGLCEISALIGLIAVFGGYSFGSLALHGTEIIEWFLLWAVIFIFVGLSEEFAFRGYAQFTLADGIGFWPAAFVLSLLFSAVHKINGGENWFGLLSIIFISLIFAFALRRTGNLWFVVGLHAAFDFGETFLFSVPNSGVRFEGHLSNASLSGSPWLTGGTAGPEGSALSYLTMGCLALFIHFAFPAKKADVPAIENSVSS
jgi:membrane protease YdiL (CAAX protease family)